MIRTAAVALLICTNGVFAEDISLFDAVNAGPDVWTWADARLVSKEGKLVITPSSDKNVPGNVYLEDRFLYSPKGILNLQVDRLMGGTYTVQVLAFKGTTFLGSADVLKESVKTGPLSFPLSGVPIPPGTETISFKIWVSKTAGGGLVLGSLRYDLPLVAGSALYDKTIDTATTVTTDRAVWTMTDKGGMITLAQGQQSGCVLLPDRIQKPDAGVLVLQAGDVKNGSLTAQIVAFDASSNYVGSVDAAKKMTATLSARLENIEWPAGTAEFQVKVWLGGTQNPSAVLKRLLIVK
jgi:hypothetical protein